MASSYERNTTCVWSLRNIDLAVWLLQLTLVDVLRFIVVFEKPTIVILLLLLVVLLLSLILCLCLSIEESAFILLPSILHICAVR